MTLLGSLQIGLGLVLLFSACQSGPQAGGQTGSELSCTSDQECIDALGSGHRCGEENLCEPLQPDMGESLVCGDGDPISIQGDYDDPTFEVTAEGTVIQLSVQVDECFSDRSFLAATVEMTADSANEYPIELELLACDQGVTVHSQPNCEASDVPCAYTSAEWTWDDCEARALVLRATSPGGPMTVPLRIHVFDPLD